MTQFVKGQEVEYSNSEYGLNVIDVIECGFVTYAVVQGPSGEYAAAFDIDGDENDGWYFVNDDETTWQEHRYAALGQVVIAMHEHSKM